MNDFTKAGNLSSLGTGRESIGALRYPMINTEFNFLRELCIIVPGGVHTLYWSLDMLCYLAFLLMLAYPASPSIEREGKIAFSILCPRPPKFQASTTLKYTATTCGACIAIDYIVTVNTYAQQKPIQCIFLRGHIDGSAKSLRYCSRFFNKAEDANYTTQLELFAFFWAVLFLRLLSDTIRSTVQTSHAASHWNHTGMAASWHFVRYWPQCSAYKFQDFYQAGVRFQVEGSL